MGTASGAQYRHVASHERKARSRAPEQVIGYPTACFVLGQGKAQALCSTGDQDAATASGNATSRFMVLSPVPDTTSKGGNGWARNLNGHSRLLASKILTGRSAAAYCSSNAVLVPELRVLWVPCQRRPSVISPSPSFMSGTINCAPGSRHWAHSSTSSRRISLSPQSAMACFFLNCFPKFMRARYEIERQVLAGVVQPDPD